MYATRRRRSLVFSSDSDPPVHIDHIFDSSKPYKAKLDQGDVYLRDRLEIYVVAVDQWLAFDGESPYFWCVQYDIGLISFLQPSNG